MEEEEINKIFKPKRMPVVLFLFYLIIAIVCIGIVFYMRYEKTKEPLNLAEQISNKTEKEGQYAEVDIAYLPQLIAVNPEKENALYFVTDEENNLYIARLSNKTFDYLKSIYNEESGKLNHLYHIEGLTYNIDAFTESSALRTSNKLFPEKGLTSDNFSQNLGTVYIYDNMIIGDSGVITLLQCSALTGVFFLILAFFYLFPFILNAKKVLKNKDLVDDLKIELTSLTINQYHDTDFKLYLTKNYIFSIFYGQQIIRYEDIIWGYVFIRSELGMETGRALIIYTKDKKKHTIATVKSANNILENALADIQDKNANMKVGYNEENKEFFKNFTKQVEKEYLR